MNRFNSIQSSPPSYFVDNVEHFPPEIEYLSQVDQTAHQIAAEQGIPTANFFLGACYDSGDGVSYDPTKAAEHYYIAAEAGLAEAQHNLGCCYINGEGVDRNLKTALGYLIAAFKQGYAPSMHLLGQLMESKDASMAAKYYTKAAERGHAQSLFCLGCLYDSGKGVHQNFEEAVKLYYQAAELGVPEAQYNLACSFEMGQGVAQNFEESVRYYTLAADQGHAMAQFNLAQCYHYGKGVAVNKSGAVYYYELASQQGIEVPPLNSLAAQTGTWSSSSSRSFLSNTHLHQQGQRSNNRTWNSNIRGKAQSQTQGGWSSGQRPSGFSNRQHYSQQVGRNSQLLKARSQSVRWGNR